MCSFPLGGFGIGTNGIPCAVGRLAVEFGRNCTSGCACPRFYLFLTLSLCHPYVLFVMFVNSLRVPICKSFRLMPPSWFLRVWTDHADLRGISRGLRVWRHLREIPGGYCGGHWPRPVRRGPALAERSVSTSRRIARPAWFSSRRGSEAIPGR